MLAFREPVGEREILFLRERYKELLSQAESERLAQLATIDGKKEHSFSKYLFRLGRLLAARGKKRLESFSSLDESLGACNYSRPAKCTESCD